MARENAKKKGKKKTKAEELFQIMKTETYEILAVAVGSRFIDIDDTPEKAAKVAPPSLGSDDGNDNDDDGVPQNSGAAQAPEEPSNDYGEVLFYLHSASQLTLLHRSRDMKRPVSVMKFTHGGQKLFAASHDYSLYVYDIVNIVVEPVKDKVASIIVIIIIVIIIIAKVMLEINPDAVTMVSIPLLLVIDVPMTQVTYHIPLLLVLSLL